MLSTSRRKYCTVILALPLLVLVFQAARAERLPLKAYTPADGLAHYVINRIVRDSHGFLWFCTDDGLSQFDGYTFTNYRTEQGLPHAVVNDILETREGDYWVATNGGLCKFNLRGVPTNRVIYADHPAADAPPEPMFLVFTPGLDNRNSRAIEKLLQRHDGTIWCGTLNGVFRLDQMDGRLALLPVEIGLPTEYAEQRVINTLLEDRGGTLWLGAGTGLYRLWPDGRVAHYGKRNGLPDDDIHDLLEDHDGNLWMGTRYNGLFRLATGAGYEPPVITHSYNAKNGLGTNWVFALYESSDGKLWVGTNGGLCEFSLGGEKGSDLLHCYTKQNGFIYHEITQVSEDRDSNLWLGTINGAMKLTRNGFTTFDERDGLCCMLSFFASGAGEFYAYGNILGNQRNTVFEGAKLDLLTPTARYVRRVGRFDGQRFTWLIPDALKNRNLGWPARLALQSRLGEWWFGTAEGLYLFPRTSSFAALKTAGPMAVYTTRDGLAAPDVYYIYEDSRGDLWVSTVGSSSNGLARWERATRTLHDMAQTAGLPSLKEKLPTAFQEDRAGNVWVGFSQGELGRYRDGRFTLFTTADGLPAGRVSDLYLDRAGRLWIAMTRGGLSRLDEPTAERPTLVNYSVARGLSSNYVTAITEDHYGRIYIGTGQGLDGLEPATGRLTHYTTADGLALGRVMATFCDQDGSVWVGTTTGLSHFRPDPPQPSAPAPILINGLSVAGAPRRVSATGETQITLPALQPGENQVQIEFVGLSFASGEVLRYQYRLEGAAADWSAPTEQRTVNFANLAPGRYRFLVRAVNSDGVTSLQPAAITFSVLRPVWQRWWFVSLAMLAVALTVYALLRYRLARILEVANIRTRIAADLHDDIGSNLTRIAILSEVAHSQLSNENKNVDSQLLSVARISRESVASMSDIVWAINPKRDSLLDLIQRMRRFANEILAPRAIEFQFLAPEVDQDLKLGADIRRNMFLVFKEALNNAVRHSECTSAHIELLLERLSLVLVVRDNGRGFAPDNSSEGQGLVSMRRRASSLGGELQVNSDRVRGRGTEIVLRVPRRPH